MIIDQLTDIYLNKETWHKNKLSKEEADEYHRRLIMQKNIITYIEDKKLIGYIEVWKINFEQLGRLICEIPFFVFDENITDGNIAYISNMWISPDHRFNLVNKRIVKDFFNRFSSCEYMLLRRIKWNYAFKVYPMMKFKGAVYASRKNNHSI